MLGPVVTKLGIFNTNPTGLTFSAKKYRSNPPTHRFHPVRDWGDNKGKETSNTNKKEQKQNKKNLEQTKTSEDIMLFLFLLVVILVRLIVQY